MAIYSPINHHHCVVVLLFADRGRRAPPTKTNCFYYLTFAWVIVVVGVVTGDGPLP